MPCTSAYYEKPKHVKESANCIRKMHLLTRDVGISIALTMKIVVQFTVATDVYLSTLFVTPCTYSLVKMKHVKLRVNVHTKLHVSTRDVTFHIGEQKRRLKLSSTMTLCDNVYISSQQWSRKLKHVKRRGRCTDLHMPPQLDTIRRRD